MPWYPFIYPILYKFSAYKFLKKTRIEIHSYLQFCKQHLLCYRHKRPATLLFPVHRFVLSNTVLTLNQALQFINLHPFGLCLSITPAYVTIGSLYPVHHDVFCIGALSIR